MITERIYKKLAKLAFRKINANSSKNVEFFENLIHNGFCKIGIGSGGGVDSSGERGVFALLKQYEPPYCIFDIGANRGKYLDLIIESIYGGGGIRFATNSFRFHANSLL